MIIQDGNGARVKSTNIYQNLAAGASVTSTVTLYNPDVITNGDNWADSGTGTSREFAYNATGAGLQYVQVDLGAVYSVTNVTVWHYNPGGRTYHATKTQVSADGRAWTTIFNSAVSGEYAETPTGKTSSFTAQNVRYIRDYLNGNSINAGNHWVEIEAMGYADVTYIGSHFEWLGSVKTMASYYYAGGQRVAMRRGSVLNYLLGDHLGSNSLSVDNITGTRLTELRYKAWGEDRTAQNPGRMPTSYAYTGQRTEVAGLYFYNARWYDSYLNQFSQPDTLIPDQYNTLDWNRYQYARANPLKYTDPSGHNPECGPDGAFCDGDVSNDLDYRTDVTININIIGFNTGESAEIWTAILNIASNLSKIMGQTPWDAFNRVFSGVTISAASDLGGWFGFHSGNSVELLSGKVTSQLAAHELGHVFEKRVYGALGKLVSKAPANMLASPGTSISDKDGNHVTGVFQGNFRRTMLGYGTCGYKCAYHPVDMMPEGDSAYEDFADMFMNWSFDSFDYRPEANGAGYARYNWMNTNMSTWVSYLP